MHPNAARVAEAAAAHGLAIEIRDFPEGTRTAEDAAAAIGCKLGQIVKSLVFTVDGDPVIALVSGSNQLDKSKLAATVAAAGHGGEGEVGRADADLVRSATGYPIGGVPPFGHATTLPTFVDEDLLTYELVWAAAGTPRGVFAITTADLLRLANATAARLA